MRKILVGLATFMLVLAACGGASATPTPAAPATVQLASSSLGQIIVDGAGRTLYAFTPDQAAGAPTCYTTCATNWPAKTVTGSFTVGTGLDQSKFKTVARTDGGSQLQVGDFPLYYFASDTGAGQTNGQGVGGKWYVVGADGQPIKQ
jgi:predicted lipoprotein with Yx(FWY)xxD motif